MTTYRIDLLPLGHFFFAQELIAELGNKSNYYQQSALFPQQTTLLGMLRHQLLLQHNLIPLYSGTNSQHAPDIIGNGSFLVANPTGSNSFGHIKSISPCFLSNSEELFLLRNRERTSGNPIEDLFLSRKPVNAWRLIAINDHPTFLKVNNCHYLAFTKDDNVVPYTPKNDWIERMVSVNGTEGPTLDKIIQSYEQTGIAKAFEQNTKNASYYIYKYQRLSDRIPIRSASEKYCLEQIKYYNLIQGWQFTFFALSENNALRPMVDAGPRTVTMGKEQGLWMMTVRPEEPPALPSESGDYTKIVLITDCFIPDEKDLNSLALLISGSTRRFRNMEFYVDNDDTKYSRRPKVSKVYNLLQRGSVIYVTNENLPLVKKLIDDVTHFVNIGYNHYITYKIELN